MAEKFRIFEAEIDTSKAVQATIELKKERDEMIKQNKELKQSEKELTPEYVENEAKIKALNLEIRRNEAVTKAQVTANKSQEGSLNQLKAQLSIVTAEWNALSENERLNTEQGQKLTAVKTKLTAQLTKEEKATGDARRQVGFYERNMSEATEATSKFIPGAGNAANAAKMLSGAFKLMLGPVGIAIALIATIIKSFQSFFTSTEKGQNTLRMLKMVFSTVFDSVNRILSKFAETIIWAFTEPQKAIDQLWQAIKQNFVNRLTGIVDQVKAFGAILQGVFELDWEKIKKGGLDFANATIQIVTGVEDAIGKTKKAFSELADEQAKRIAEAQRIAKLQDDLDKRQRQTLVENAKLQTQIDKLREETAKKEEYTAQQRLKLLDEAIEKEKQLEANNVEILKRKLEIRQAQNALTLSTKEDLEEEARLQAELISAEGAAARKRRELESQRVEAIRAIRAEQKAIEDKEFAAIELLFDEMEKQIAKELALKKEALKTEEQLKEEAKKRELARIQTNYDNELALAESNLFRFIDKHREGLDMQKAQELAYAELIGADKQLIADKYAAMDMALEQQKTDAKLAIASSFAGQLATLFGQQTKLGKAAAIAQTVINTYTGAMAAFAQTPGGIIIKSTAATLASAVGIKQISEILKVNTNISAGAVASTPSSPTVSTPTAVTPQLGSSIAGQGVSTSTGQMTQRAVKGLSQVQDILVVDKVTAKQKVQTRNNRIGSI